MNEVVKSLMERRSVRQYTDRQVEPEVLDQILQAGTYAATGMGKQSPRIVAVQDPETVRLLSKMNAGRGQRPLLWGPYRGHCAGG